jgi:hypothetical protein
MTCGDARQMVPYVMDLYSQIESKQKVTTSNGGESKWDKNQHCLPHPTDQGNAACSDSLIARVG